jgi:hypothetical protein
MIGVRGRLADCALDERAVLSVAEGASGGECQRTGEGEEARGADEEEDEMRMNRQERRGVRTVGSGLRTPQKVRVGHRG